MPLNLILLARNHPLILSTHCLYRALCHTNYKKLTSVGVEKKDKTGFLLRLPTTMLSAPLPSPPREVCF